MVAKKTRAKLTGHSTWTFAKCTEGIRDWRSANPGLFLVLSLSLALLSSGTHFNPLIWATNRPKWPAHCYWFCFILSVSFNYHSLKSNNDQRTCSRSNLRQRQFDHVNFVVMCFLSTRMMETDFADRENTGVASYFIIKRPLGTVNSKSSFFLFIFMFIWQNNRYKSNTQNKKVYI